MLCLLFDRVQNILQDLSSGLICRLDGVCVNLAGGSRICVSQPCRNSCQVRTGGNEQRCVGVPLRYNYDKPEKPRRIKGFEVFSLVFHPFPNRKITLK